MNIVIKNINGGNDEYQLKENDKTIVQVRHRRDMNTARVETIKGQRVLIIEKEGLIKRRVVIKNEYGVEIGQMAFDNWSDSQGVVQLDNIRYKFTLNASSSQELYIYKGSRKNLVYQCNLAFEKGNQSQLKDHTSAFIISIAWYLHLQPVMEKVPELVS